MKTPPNRGEVTRVPSPNLKPRTNPDWRWSLPPSLPRVEKATPSESGFYRLPETYPSVYCKGGCPYHNADTPSEGSASTADAPGAREAAGEPARPAAERAERASSPERAPSAPRRAHRLDQPEAGACPPTRKADRTGDQREPIERRSR